MKELQLYRLGLLTGELSTWEKHQGFSTLLAQPRLGKMMQPAIGYLMHKMKTKYLQVTSTGSI